MRAFMDPPQKKSYLANPAILSPSQHSQGSDKYWLAVANQTVRTYCSFQVELKALEGVISLISQSPLREFQGESGKSCVLTHLDMDGIGESLGPGQRPQSDYFNAFRLMMS